MRPLVSTGKEFIARHYLKVFSFCTCFMVFIITWSIGQFLKSFQWKLYGHGRGQLFQSIHIYIWGALLLLLSLPLFFKLIPGRFFIQIHKRLGLKEEQLDEQLPTENVLKRTNQFVAILTFIASGTCPGMSLGKIAFGHIFL